MPSLSGPEARTFLMAKATELAAATVPLVEIVTVMVTLFGKAFVAEFAIAVLEPVQAGLVDGIVILNASFVISEQLEDTLLVTMISSVNLVQQSFLGKDVVAVLPGGYVSKMFLL